MLGDVGQQACGLLPTGDVENAAAYMCLQSHDREACVMGMTHELLELRDWHSELGMSASGTYVVVMATANARIDANEYFTLTENFRPRRQHVSVIDSDAHPLLERPNVLGTGRKVRGEENSQRVDVREEFQCTLNFAPRHALEFDAFRPDGL